MISQIIFIVILGLAIFSFWKAVSRITKNINLGRPEEIKDHPAERWKTMFMVAIGQSKMVKRPLAGIMHILIYVGFIIINVEVLEILIDGVLGTHRIFSFLGSFYTFLISAFEF